MSKNIIESITTKVKALFADEAPAEEAVETAMAEAVVKDTGITIMAESWEVGKEVTTVTEEGDQIAIPEGNYELEDGTILSIDADGKILEVVMPDAEVEVEVETKEKKEEEMKAEDKEPVYITEQDLAAAMTPILEALTKVSVQLSAKKPEVEKEETPSDKIQAENMLLKQRLAEKRKNIAPKAERKEQVLSNKSRKRGHRNTTVDRVNSQFADFDFQLDKN